VQNNNIKFNCIFYHGGEFVREEAIFYRGGLQTSVADIAPDTWKVGVIKQVVCSWGYQEHEFRLWCKMDEVVNEFVKLDQDHIADEVAMFAVSRGIDGQIYVEHNVTDMSVKVDMPHFVDLNGSKEEDEDEDKLSMYSSDDGGAKGVKFDDCHTLILDLKILTQIPLLFSKTFKFTVSSTVLQLHTLLFQSFEFLHKIIQKGILVISYK